MPPALNPFAANPDARPNSSYGRFEDGQLIVDGDNQTGRMTNAVHSALRAVLQDPDFPCVGAKSVMNQGGYRFGLYAEIDARPSTAGLACDLARFVTERQSLPGEFSSFIASFLEPKVRTPKQFEALLWHELAALHDLDREHFDWCDSVSRDPTDPNFSFSFAGQPFFVVGLAPSTRRWARRFPWPTLVFNDHDQFERLREEHRFDRIRDVVRERDEHLHGSRNEMLEDHGQHSEARQYAGRRVSASWRCPVHFD